MTRRRLAGALLALMVIGSVAWTVAWQPLHPPPLHPGDHHALEAFVLDVASRTPPGCAIFFVLPPEDADSGLANHRLRHLLGPRQVSTNLDNVSPRLRHVDYVAVWRNGHGTLEAAR